MPKEVKCPLDFSTKMHRTVLLGPRKWKQNFVGVTSEWEEETVNGPHLARCLAKKWRERELQRKAEAGVISLLLFVCFRPWTFWICFYAKGKELVNGDGWYGKRMGDQRSKFLEAESWWDPGNSSQVRDRGGEVSPWEEEGLLITGVGRRGEGMLTQACVWTENRRTESSH